MAAAGRSQILSIEHGTAVVARKRATVCLYFWAEHAVPGQTSPGKQSWVVQQQNVLISYAEAAYCSADTLASAILGVCSHYKSGSFASFCCKTSALIFEVSQTDFVII